MGVPEPPEPAAMWCNDCKKLRNADGSWPEYVQTWSFPDPRCGHDYGPGSFSHLDVVMLRPSDV